MNLKLYKKQTSITKRKIVNRITNALQHIVDLKLNDIEIDVRKYGSEIIYRQYLIHTLVLYISYSINSHYKYYIM